jgi:hypothetical protein
MTTRESGQVPPLDTRITLAFLWVALMLTYLLGDVLRIFSGDFDTPGVIEGMVLSQGMWLGISILMVTPILMILMSIMLRPTANRRANLIVPAFFFLFNIVGLPTYASIFDQFLIVVGLGFNLLMIWYAWKWQF